MCIMLPEDEFTKPCCAEAVTVPVINIDPEPVFITPWPALPVVVLEAPNTLPVINTEPTELFITPCALTALPFVPPVTFPVIFIVPVELLRSAMHEVAPIIFPATFMVPAPLLFMKIPLANPMLLAVTLPKILNVPGVLNKIPVYGGPLAALVTTFPTIVKDCPAPKLIV